MPKRKSLATADFQDALARIPAGIRHLFADPQLLPWEKLEDYSSLLVAIADDVNPDGAIEWLRIKDILWLTQDIERLRSIKHQVIELARGARADKLATELYHKRKPHLSEMSPGEAEALYIKSLEETEAKSKKEHADFEALSPEAAEAWINFVETDYRARRPEFEIIHPWFTPIRAVEAYQQMLKAPVRPLSERVDPETKRQLMSELTTEPDFAQAFLDSIDPQQKLDRMIISLERRRDIALREIEVHREIRARRLRETSAKVIRSKGFPSLAAAE